MKVLIISDTHRMDDRFLRVMEQEAPVDMIIHAGDAEGSEDYFEAIAGMPILYVSGNNDYSSLAPRTLVFPIGSRKALLTHGHLYQVSRSTAILEAEAEKEAAILRAEAKKEAMIREAEGRAQAIQAVQKATADGIQFLNESNPSQAVLTLKSLEAFEKAADGKATKIIIPSEIQGVAGLAKSITEVVKEK